MACAAASVVKVMAVARCGRRFLDPPEVRSRSVATFSTFPDSGDRLGNRFHRRLTLSSANRT
jgi:hypothetical protein